MGGREVIKMLGSILLKSKMEEPTCCSEPRGVWLYITAE